MKLCKDCKHFRVGVNERVDLGKCAAPPNLKTSLVTGESTIGGTGYEFAETLRVRLCGPAAKWYEPISPLAEVERPPARRPWWKLWAA